MAHYLTFLRAHSKLSNSKKDSERKSNKIDKSPTGLDSKLEIPSGNL
jgi:hypothetical protein